MLLAMKNFDDYVCPSVNLFRVDRVLNSFIASAGYIRRLLTCSE